MSGAESTPAGGDAERFSRELERMREENVRLRRVLDRRERTNQVLAKVNEQAERMRRANEEDKKLQYLYNDLLLKNSPNIVLLFNENLRYALGSENYTPLIGRDRGNLLNQPLERVFSDKVDANWVYKIHNQCRQALDNQEHWRYNDTIAMQGSAPLKVQVSVSPIVEESGRPRGAIVSITDVGELVEARRKAEEAARSKSDFLANMSHEIRTPMNAILGIAEILLHDDSLRDGQRKYIGDIKMSADSLLTIINDILDISKLESGNMTLSPVPFDFRQFTDNICSLARYLATEKQLGFHVETDGRLPDCLVADDVRLRQVLVNILGNAVKFTEKGEIGLRLAVLDDELRFDVSDTGIGIRPEDQARLFQPFKQVDTTRNRNIKGTGLGLSISKNIVQLMGGTIAVESEPGRGSVFTVTVPKVVGDVAAITTTKQSHRVLYADKVRILIVDDNEINLSVAVGLLKTLYDIDSDRASSGREALERVSEEEYDIIFMDHMMPDMDGVETTARIRERGGWCAKAPIVALTANAVAGAREMLLAASMDDFLPKPLQKGELDRVLRKWVPKRYQLGTRVIERPAAAATESEGGVGDGEEGYSRLLQKVGCLPEISIVDGLDGAAGSEEVYERSLKLLTEKIPGICDLMEGLLVGGDLAGLTIHVHGMKSSLASVGAGALSRQAKELEHAAGSGDADFCGDYLPPFVMQLRGLGERLQAIFAAQSGRRGGGDGDGVEKGDVEGLRVELGRLHEALSSYDVEVISSCLEPMLRLDFGEGVNSLLAMLRDKVDAFDYDGAKAFISFHFPEVL